MSDQPQPAGDTGGPAAGVETEMAEVFWFHTRLLAANAVPEGGRSELYDVSLPVGLAARLNAACDAYSAVVDEVMDHLRATGQQPATSASLFGRQE